MTRPSGSVIHNPSDMPSTTARSISSWRRVSSMSMVKVLVSQLVADPADRLDDLARGAQLLAQPLHVGVDGAGGDVGLDAPDVAEQRLAGLHPARALEKGLEQAKLEGGQRHA